MKHVIHIFGASGSGTTTLGRALAADMGLVHMDTDHYYWLPTDPKFTTKRPIEERLRLMNADIDAAQRGVVISGSLTGWGDPLIPRFTHVIRLNTPTKVRIERLRARESAHFGERIARAAICIRITWISSTGPPSTIPATSPCAARPATMRG